MDSGEKIGPIATIKITIKIGPIVTIKITIKIGPIATIKITIKIGPIATIKITIKIGAIVTIKITIKIGPIATAQPRADVYLAVRVLIRVLSVVGVGTRSVASRYRRMTPSDSGCSTSVNCDAECNVEST